MKPYGKKPCKNMCLCCTPYAKQQKAASKKHARQKAKKQIEESEE